MNWKKLLRHRSAKWAGLALVVVVAGTWFSIRQLYAKPVIIPIYTNVDRGDVIDTVEATGTVDAVTTVQVGAQVSGRIDRLGADFNSVVKKGQLLAHIEDSLFVSAFKSAEADLAAARANIKVSQVGIESAQQDLVVARANLASDEAVERQAKIDFDRTQALFDSKVSAASDLDTARSTYRQAQAAAASSRALVTQAQAALATAQSQLQQAIAAEGVSKAAFDQAKMNLEWTNIVSPVDGTVEARNIDIGQTIASNLSAPDLFDIAKDLTQMYVYTKLDVRDVPKVQVGMKATFTVDAFPKLSWEGTVLQVRISPITTLKGQNVTPSQLTNIASANAGIPGLSNTSSSTSSTTSSSSTSSSTSTTSSSSSSSTTIGGSSGGTAASVSPDTVPAATSAPGLVQYDGLIAFTNTNKTLIPGMDAYVTIPVSSAYDVIRIRKETLRASPSISLDEKNALLKRYGIGPNQYVVWLVEGESFRPVAVTIGKTDYVYAEVTSGNLQPGQRILAGYRTQ